MKGKICQQENGRYYVRVCFRGKDYKIYRNAKGERLWHINQAEALLGAVRTEMAERRFNPDRYQDSKTPYRFEAVIEKWIDTHQGDYKKTISSINRVQFKELHHKDIRELLGIDITGIHNRVKDMPSAITIIAVLKAFLRWAWEQYNILSDFPKFPKVKPPAERKGWLTREQQEEVLKHVPPYYLPIIKFCVYHGVRPSEARFLKWTDVDLDREVVLIRHHKTGNETLLPLHPDMVEVLNAIPHSLNPHVFRGRVQQDQVISRSRLQTAWTNAATKAGYGHICLYEGTRHSLASQAATGGESLLIISRVLGHNKMQTTMRYAKVATEALRRVIVPIRSNTGQTKKELK